MPITSLAISAFKKTPALDPVIFAITNKLDADSTMPYQDVISQVVSFIRENPLKFTKPKPLTKAPAVGFVSTPQGSAPPPLRERIILPLAVQCNNCNPNYAGKQYHTRDKCPTLVGGAYYDQRAYEQRHRHDHSISGPWTSADADRYKSIKQPVPRLTPPPPAPSFMQPPGVYFLPTAPTTSTTTALVPTPPAATAPVPAAAVPTVTAAVPPPTAAPPQASTRTRPTRNRGPRPAHARFDPYFIANQAYVNSMLDEFDRNQDDDYSDYLDNNYY